MSDSAFRSSIGIENWYNHDVVQIENDKYLARIIPDIGANCIVLRDKINQMELLRSPKSYEELQTNPAVYGLPVLFLPNRIDGGKIVTALQVYKLPVTEAAGTYLHGFLHTSRWSIIDYWASDQEAHITLKFTHGSNRESYAYFPHNFSVVLHYTLSQSGLTQAITFSNEDSMSFPFAIGCHTALQLPAASCEDWSSCRLLLSARKRWELDNRHLPTGTVQELKGDDIDLLRDGLNAADKKISALFSAGSIQTGEQEFHGAILWNSKTGYAIEYAVDPSYRFWVLWNGGGGRGFVCPEPQTWAINAPNLELTEEDTGMRIIDPGEIVALSSRLSAGNSHIY